ncbi:MAG: hypothetical protein WCG25_00145 [bacterium]
MENTNRQYIAGRLTAVDLWKQSARNRKMDINKIYTPDSYLELFKNYIDK